eukprot:Skav228663  [mRNA]  locus=scaffold2369:283890:285401:+ [translate_table: standard]
MTCYHLPLLQVPVPPEFHKIQGMWRTEADSQTMGEIRGSTVIWDKVFNLSQSKLRLASDGAFEMTLSGAVHKAHTDRLIWSDGEVWVAELHPNQATLLTVRPGAVHLGALKHPKWSRLVGEDMATWRVLEMGNLLGILEKRRVDSEK